MRLLLAEDERDLNKAIVRVLKANKYDIDSAYDGEEALTKLYDNNYDALILDVMMPKMDGFEVTRELRQAGNNIPILMLTARSEIDDKVMGLDAGADDYLTKPFSVKELLARIRAIVRRTGEGKESYQIGNTILDKNLFELKAVTSLHLTSKEYQIMEFLIRNKNALISTEKLMDSIWSFDSEAEINVVWAYISSLRKKLTEVGSDYTIKAVRGVGYQLAPINEK